MVPVQCTMPLLCRSPSGEWSHAGLQVVDGEEREQDVTGVPERRAQGRSAAVETCVLHKASWRAAVSLILTTKKGKNAVLLATLQILFTRDIPPGEYLQL